MLNVFYPCENVCMSIEFKKKGYNSIINIYVYLFVDTKEVYQDVHSLTIEFQEIDANKNSC